MHFERKQTSRNAPKILFVLGSLGSQLARADDADAVAVRRGNDVLIDVVLDLINGNVSVR